MTCAYALAPPTQTAPAEGGSVRVTVATAQGCTWTATSTVPWLVVTAGATGSGVGTVTLQVAANTGTAQRSGAVSVGGQSATVTQAGAAPAPAACTFSVVPRSLTPGAEGATASVEITASAATCNWTASSSVPWATLSAAGGSGNGQVRVTVAPNTGTAARTGSLTIAGATVSITQTGAAPPPPPTCAFAFTPDALSVPALGGAAASRLETGATCAWTAVSSALWLVVTNPAGTGSATISLQVLPNTSTSARSATVQVGSQRLTVTQAGLSVTPEELRFDGQVSQLSGLCPSLTFRVAGRTVRTSAATMFPGNSCPAVRNGVEVEVRGFQQPDGNVLATRVQVTGDDKK